MKIAIMQPYFFPYIGYFQLINAVDKFIFLDDVNFIKQGWINRNRILLNGNSHIFTLAIKSASSNKLINQIEICEGNDRILKTIKHAYSKAPYFKDIFPLIQQVFETMFEIKSISKIAITSVQKVSEYLGLYKFFETTSEKYGLTRELFKEERLIAICQKNQADIYVNPSGGTELYCKNTFLQMGIQLFFIKNHFTQYKQFNHSFINGLSMIDVMMFNDKKTIKTFLDNYELE